jgi:predicted MFS family arabinose efflux permease
LLLIINLSATGALLFLDDFASILIISFLGMVNGMGKERGAAVALESAALPQTATEADRTKVFAWYNVVIDVGHGLGAAVGALPALLQQNGLAELESYRLTLGAYGAFMTLALLATLMLSKSVELGERKQAAALSPASKKIVLGFAALSWLDSFGSGFIAGSILSVWISETYHVGVEAIGALYLAGNIANAVSHFGAAWLSKKIGLVNTMVFTHIPSSLLLVTVPFAPNFPVAALLFLLREGLVEMDVPTRQSYVMAVVRAEERTIASGITHLVRLGSWAVAPAFAGVMMRGLALGTPLFVGAGMKIGYDLLLYAAFRRHRPPEERGDG